MISETTALWLPLAPCNLQATSQPLETSLSMGPQARQESAEDASSSLHIGVQDAGIGDCILEKGMILMQAHSSTGDLQPCSLLQAPVISRGDSADTKLVSRSPLCVLTVSSVLRDRKDVTEVTTAGGQAGH